MYKLTNEDITIMSNYRDYLKNMVKECENEQAKMILEKSVALLSGEINSEMLQKYLEIQVKKDPNFTAQLTKDTKQAINDIRVAANQYGVMDVVKRFKQG